MRIPILLTCLGASMLALSAQAQETQPPPPADQPATETPPAPVDNGTSVPPPAPDTAMPPPPPPAAYNAVPAGAPPAQIVMGPSQPQVQNVPEPPAEYPRCSRTVKDACRNPGS